MLGRKRSPIYAWCKETWEKFKVVSLVFLILVLLSTGLLMTSLPKSALLWATFVVAIIIPPLVLSWKGRRNKIYKNVSSPNISHKISDFTWEDIQEKQNVIFRVQANSNMHSKQAHTVA